MEAWRTEPCLHDPPVESLLIDSEIQLSRFRRALGDLHILTRQWFRKQPGAGVGPTSSRTPSYRAMRKRLHRVKKRKKDRARAVVERISQAGSLSLYPGILSIPGPIRSIHRKRVDTRPGLTMARWNVTFNNRCRSLQKIPRIVPSSLRILSNSSNYSFLQRLIDGQLYQIDTVLIIYKKDSSIFSGGWNIDRYRTRSFSGHGYNVTGKDDATRELVSVGWRVGRRRFSLITGDSAFI